MMKGTEGYHPTVGTLGRVATKAHIVYWKPAKRPQGWVGPQGQNSHPEVGDEIIAYCKRKDRDEKDTYHLIEPNGWEKQKGGREEI